MPKLDDGSIDELLAKVADKNKRHSDEIGLLRKGFEGATDGFWVWYLLEDYEYMSPKFKKALGYKDDEFPNHPSSWQKLIFPEDFKIATENFEKHVATKGK